MLSQENLKNNSVPRLAADDMMLMNAEEPYSYYLVKLFSLSTEESESRFPHANAT